MQSEEDKLDDIRKKIDSIDAQIQTLINERAQCALAVAKIKTHNKKMPVIYRPEREMQILRKVMARNQGPLSKKAMADIFLAIMAKCRALQQPIKIALLGPKNSLSHKAVNKHFGSAVDIAFTNSIKKIFTAVINKKVSYGIVAIENNKQGAVLGTLEQLAESSVQICGEIDINQDRFLIIGTEVPAPSGYDKTSLVIFIANKPGSLAKILQPFANHQVNVTFIDYFPYRNDRGSYVFFVDIEGHPQDETVHAALEDLAKQALTYTVLGSYPRAL